jgi:hypothetical protein
MSYDSHANYNAFIAKYSERGLRVLNIWNTVDPLHCYYGDEVNPDEYVRPVTRYLEGNKSVEENLTAAFLPGFGPGPEAYQELLRLLVEAGS